MLNEAGISSVSLFITATGLHKAILDATEPMRGLFLRNGIHNYALQKQGEAGKVILDSVFLDDSGSNATSVSLYRPLTKQGDPRMWFYGLAKFARPDDVLAVFIYKGAIHALNVTLCSLMDAKINRTKLGLFFEPLWKKAHLVSDELLSLLKEIAAKGPLKASCKGDTAVGRSIETALGISINSDRHPDYKGIEIKSGRSSLIKRATRATLFACVPDWSISTLKSSADILKHYGYQRGDVFKLYCTVTTRKANTQTLQFTIDSTQRWLKEIAAKNPIEEVVIWKLDTLESRLSEKHHETFWIKASAEVVMGTEYYQLKSVTHTRDPNIPQLERMLSDGSITMDHLIKRQLNGRVTEKGPLFKIERNRIKELFLGQPKEYSLI